jgi:hypothetical protein
MEGSRRKGMIFYGLEMRVRMDWGLRLESGHNEDK